MITQSEAVFGFLLGIIMIVFSAMFMYFFIGIASYKRPKSTDNILLELHESDEPQMFNLIRDISDQMSLKMPRRIFLIPGAVTAITLPGVWKNLKKQSDALILGAGLINACSIEEFKTLIAHELAHSAQRSNILNLIIQFLDRFAQGLFLESNPPKWILHNAIASNNYLVLMFQVPFLLYEKIRKGMLNLYTRLLKQKQTFSRAMEYNADEIAARIFGKNNFVSLLVKYEFAEKAIDQVNQIYNLYPQLYSSPQFFYEHHRQMIHHYANILQIETKHDIIYPTLSQYKSIRTTKIDLKNPWDGHPSMIDRIRHVEKFPEKYSVEVNLTANSLFTDLNQTASNIINHYVDIQSLEGVDSQEALAPFIELIEKSVVKSPFPEVFNQYFDEISPISTTNAFENTEATISSGSLFSDEICGIAREQYVLKEDIAILRDIVYGLVKVVAFEYNDTLYKKKQVSDLLEDLVKQEKKQQEELNLHTNKIRAYFKHISQKYSDQEYENLYSQLEMFQDDYFKGADLVRKIQMKLEFINVRTPFDEISFNFYSIRKLEDQWLSFHRLLLEDPPEMEEPELAEMINVLNAYAAMNKIYFSETSYLEDNLNILQRAIFFFSHFWNLKYHQTKKRLLLKMEELILLNQTI